MSELMVARDHYLAVFEAFERAAGPGAPEWVRTRRRRAIERFGALGLPSVRDEDWKYTSVAELATIPFQVPLDGALPLPAPESLAPLADSSATASRLVLVDGRPVAKLSSLGPLPRGVRLQSLAEALATDAALVERYLGGSGEEDRHGFTALNDAFLQDGVFLYVPRGARLSEPIHLVHVGRAVGGPTLLQPRNLVVLEPEATATVVESYAGGADGRYFTNVVTRVVAGSGAVLDHCRIQEEHPHAFHVSTYRVTQDAGSRVSVCSVTLGARFARSDLHVVLAAEGAESALSGLYVIADRQHVDTHTVVDHVKPRCTSRQLYKGVLDGRSRAVFGGRIIVRPDAQKTDAHQTNKNLLLSDGVEVDSKPQLEIFADDVKCTHGAADGQLADDALFYLRSRGIGDEAARDLLVQGFAREVLARISVEAVRARLEALVLGRLHRGRQASKEAS